MDLRIYGKDDKWCVYEPKEDITAYEVSILLGFFVSVHALAGHCDVDIPEKVKRHFVEEKEQCGFIIERNNLFKKGVRQWLRRGANWRLKPMLY